MQLEWSVQATVDLVTAYPYMIGQWLGIICSKIEYRVMCFRCMNIVRWVVIIAQTL